MEKQSGGWQKLKNDKELKNQVFDNDDAAQKHEYGQKSKNI